jgi:hypothetical protein
VAPIRRSSSGSNAPILHWLDYVDHLVARLRRSRNGSNTPIRDTDRKGAHYFRARWLFTLVYPGGLRIPDVSANTMGRFSARRDANGHER